MSTILTPRDPCWAGSPTHKVDGEPYQANSQLVAYLVGPNCVKNEGKGAKRVFCARDGQNGLYGAIAAAFVAGVAS